MNRPSISAHRFTTHLLIAFIALFASATGIRAQQAGASPVKIFIMAGQSNMQGQGEMSPVTTQGTLEHIVANDPGGDYQFLVDDRGDWVVRDDVWITDEDSNRSGLTAGYGATGTTVGPELGFGHFAGDLYEKQILIVKAAWGGKSLAVDFRPPSSDGTTGFYYTEVLNLVTDAITNLATWFPDYNGQGYKIAGFRWHQGWNDRVDSGRSAEYEANMANFIRDIRSSEHGLGLPALPFVIATTGMDGTSSYTQVEYAQLAMTDAATYPEFSGNVAVIDTRTAHDGMDFWQPVAQSPSGQGYHWNRNALTYLHIGLAMGDAMSTLSLPRCPSRLRATGGPGGVTLTWHNGLETPASVRVLRDSVEIAPSAPVTPATFLDAGAEAGVLNYELIFTMSGDPCDPLTVTFDGGITGLEASRGPGTVVLSWMNNLAYNTIEIRRNGSLIEPLLTGSATSYADTSPPFGGAVTYSVVPTNGSSTPAMVQIDLAGPPPGTAVIYEPFDYEPGSLHRQGGTTEVGLTGTWDASQVQIETMDAGLNWNELAAYGNSQRRNADNFGYAERAIAPGALDGLLDDGDTLWFSYIARMGSPGQQRNYFSIGSDGFQRAEYGKWGGLGRVPQWDVSQEHGLGTGSETAGNIFAVANIPGNINATSGWDEEIWAPNPRPDIFDAIDEVALIVGKITFGTGGADDVLEVYVPADMDTLGPVKSTISADLDQSQWDTISLFQKSRSGVDEIRIGAALDDVMPVAQAADVSIEILSLSLNATEVIVDFKGAADTAYKMTESPDIKSGFSNTIPLVETTSGDNGDGTGTGTLIWPRSGAANFGRVEKK